MSGDKDPSPTAGTEPLDDSQLDDSQLDAVTGGSIKPGQPHQARSWSEVLSDPDMIVPFQEEAVQTPAPKPQAETRTEEAGTNTPPPPFTAHW